MVQLTPGLTKEMAMDKVSMSVSRSTLEAVPERALAFLRGVGLSVGIRRALFARGYTRDDHAEGWKLLHEASGFGDAGEEIEDQAVREAAVEIDAWDEGAIRIIQASLERRFPEQAAFVLQGIRPATGAAAILGVERLLDRLDALEANNEREGSRKEDRAALDLLAKRGIDAKERARLRALVDKAQHVGDVPPPDPEDLEVAERKRTDVATRLYAWHREWSEIARVAIRRRDQLIRLGLAYRRTGAPSDSEADEAPEGSVNPPSSTS
jgi:hypothetical protein